MAGRGLTGAVVCQQENGEKSDGPGYHAAQPSRSSQVSRPTKGTKRTKDTKNIVIFAPFVATS